MKWPRKPNGSSITIEHVCSFYAQEMQITCAETGTTKNLREKYEELEKLTENDILLIDIGRSVDTVSVILQCLEKRIGFTFSRGEHFDATCAMEQGFKIRRLKDEDSINANICYAINTSGTTGTSKRVAVPYQCIMSNVNYFGKILEITPNDKILFSTSLLFDPSIIELFLFATFKTQLIITPDNYRSQPHLLSKTIEKFRPTIGQFTPTVVKMLEPKILESFRCLMIGGAAFPENFLGSLVGPRVFDVYGVTEVSCWATIREIPTAENLPIPGTSIKISEDGELILAGTRRCYVSGKLTPETGHPTGDLLDIDSVGNWRIVGRKDSQVKVRGIRMNLEEMSRDFAGYGFDTHFLLYRGKIIAMFVEGDSGLEEEVQKIVRETLPKDFHPSHIEFVKKFQVNQNGKIDDKILRQKLDHFYNGKFIHLVRKKYKIDLDENCSKNFVQLGFDSLIAAELSLCFGENADQAFRSLLDPKITVAVFLEKFKIEENGNITNSSLVEVYSIPDLPLKWKHDLRKCIDGSPLIINRLVYTASHFGVIMCIDLHTGNITWENRLETRFEASPIDVDGDVVIGAYNGEVYRFEGADGTLKWRFKTGDQIKASCCYYKRDSVYCISYDGYLYQVEKETGELLSNKWIGSGSPATPIFHHQTPICTTIRGRIIAPQWEYQHPAACFSPPHYDVASQRFLCGFVDGSTVVLCAADGEKLSALHIGTAPIFCAPLRLVNGGWCWAMENGDVVKTNEENREILGRWRFEECRFVRTPQILPNRSEILLTATNGTIIIWNPAKPSIARSIRLSDSNIFSSPLLDAENQLLISTGRDDWIKCWDFSPLNFVD